MHVAAEMFAGQPMTKFVDGPQDQQQNPENPDVVRALICEIVKLTRVLLHSRPISSQQVERNRKNE